MTQNTDGQDKQRGAIKRFVRAILGCNCPDRVFAQIEDRRVRSPVSPHTRTITIGGRLLIYIWEVDGPADLRQGISAMLAAGRHERDQRGLNRFRAVLAVDSPGDILPQASLFFSECKGRDDRMHIHVVPVDVLKDF